MILLLLHLLRLLPFLFGGHRQLALENVALRHQLAVYKRTVTRPRLCRTDRFFWITLARVWPGWRHYHRARTHLSLDKDTPDGRPTEPPGLGTIIPIPEVGGLHHRYVRRAA